MQRFFAVLVALHAGFVARLALSGPESMPGPNFGGGVLPSVAGAWLMAAIRRPDGGDARARSVAVEPSGVVPRGAR